MLIKLNKEDINEFVTIATSFEDADIDVYKGNFNIDAKSAMGIYAMDLSTPIELIVHKVGIGREEEILSAFDRYAYKN